MNGERMNTLWIIIPAYNEESIIKQSAQKLSTYINDLIVKNKISSESKILFCCDCPEDKTWEIIKELCNENPIFKGINLNKRYDQITAIHAGYMVAKDKCDFAISMDIDLQDDITLIEKFIDKYNDGYEIVYGVRNSRKGDSFFYKTCANIFYKLMQFFNIKMIYNAGEYRLISKKIIERIEKHPEKTFCFRTLIPELSTKNCQILYERQKRIGGKSKYNFARAFKIAWEIITSNSIVPIRLIIATGFFMTIISLLCGIYLIANKIGSFDHIKFLYCFITFLSGINFIFLGIVGEYGFKIYMEAKRRPLYFIDEIL